MKIRLYTQFGKDNQGKRYAYCSAREAIGDDDGRELCGTRRVYVMDRGTLDEACLQARRLGLRMLERFTLDLQSTVTVEFVNAMDEEG